MSNCVQILYNISRAYATKAKNKPFTDGVKYDRITYYPRHADLKDPPIEPSKLFMVQRVKPFKGNPRWDKRILEIFGLHEKNNDITIVKNIPEVNALLWKIKHLIKITPIQFPNGLPKDENSKTCYLHENGDLIVTQKIDPKRIQATEEFQQNPKRLDRETVCRDLRLKWLNPF
ncbi:39S ribosomal protein L30, mitochondrial [Orussus abietinus]|uniref:39S ribosomal protein L30, mitochondrial n=1 Tax=Orussus abietinus TaxID=222816 RepID=UPI000625D1F0|nr:39S ribosomal protein L30, mitochondrial [Orussus abietinus]